MAKQAEFKVTFQLSSSYENSENDKTVTEIMFFEANNTEDPVLRLIYVATFKIAHYKGSLGRVKKPFNPILGETL